MINCLNTPGDSGSGPYEIDCPFYKQGSPVEWLVWNNKLLMVLDSKSIGNEPQR